MSLASSFHSKTKIVHSEAVKREKKRNEINFSLNWGKVCFTEKKNTIGRIPSVKKFILLSVLWCTRTSTSCLLT